MTSPVVGDSQYLWTWAVILLSAFVFVRRFYFLSRNHKVIGDKDPPRSCTDAIRATDGCVDDPQIQLESDVDDSWIKIQRDHTQKVLQGLISRADFRKKLHKAQRFEALETPLQVGGRYFYAKKSNVKEHLHSIYYWTDDVRKQGQVVLDPNITFGKGVDEFIILDTYISDDGEKFAYSLTSTKDESVTIKVIDVKTAAESSIDTVTGLNISSSSISWLENHLGFFYVRSIPHVALIGTKEKVACIPDVKKVTGVISEEVQVETFLVKQQVLFHRLDTKQQSDLIVFEGPSPCDLEQQLYHTATVSSDGHFLLIEAFAEEDPYYRKCAHDTAGNMVYALDLTLFDGRDAALIGSCVTLVESLSWRWEYVYNVDQLFWFRTNFGAPHQFRVVRLAVKARTTSLPDDIENSHNQHSRRGGCATDGFDDSSRGQEGNKESTTMKDLHEMKESSGWRTIPSDAVHCTDARSSPSFGAFAFIEWIPPRADGAILDSAGVAAFTVLVLKYIVKGSHEVVLYDLSENLDTAARTPIATLPHPELGSIIGPSYFYLSTDVFYGFSSFSEPLSVFRTVIRRDLFARSTEISFDQVYGTVIRGIDSSDFDTKRLLCRTADGAGAVPVYIFGTRVALAERRRPCILHVRDSFNLPVVPSFSLEMLLFARHYGGLYCVVDLSHHHHSNAVVKCPRGGERTRGHIPHKPTDTASKSTSSVGNLVHSIQRVDDLLSVVNFLLEGQKPYCEQGKLGLLVGSNGSITAAACVNKRPDLFAAAVFECGMFDLMRYHILSGGVSTPRPPPDRPASGAVVSMIGEIVSDEGRRTLLGRDNSSGVDDGHKLESPSNVVSEIYVKDVSDAQGGILTDHTRELVSHLRQKTSDSLMSSNLGNNNGISRPPSSLVVPMGQTDPLPLPVVHTNGEKTAAGGGGGRSPQTHVTTEEGEEEEETKQLSVDTGVAFRRNLAVLGENSSLGIDTEGLRHRRAHSTSSSSVVTKVSPQNAGGGVVHSERHSGTLPTHGVLLERSPGTSPDPTDLIFRDVLSPEPASTRRNSETPSAAPSADGTSACVPPLSQANQDAGGEPKSTESFAWRRSSWFPEIGCAEESPEDSRRLRELSPLHNIRTSDPTKPYPAILAITWGRASVPSVHSFKYIAELQTQLASRSCQSGRPLPALLIEDGELADDDTSATIEDRNSPRTQQSVSAASVAHYADKICFLAEHMGASWHE